MKLKAIPEKWPEFVKEAILNACSLAYPGLIQTRSWAANSPISRVRMAGKIDKLETELSQVKNENRILRSRFSRIPPHQRPRCTTAERMDILAHKFACGWNLKQTGKAFMLEASTISSWIKRVNDDSLVKIPGPWNKYPGYLRYMTRQFKILAPVFGKKKIAEHFLRSGFQLAATSVGRYLKAEPTKDDGPPVSTQPEVIKDENGRVVKSYHPNHTWMVDFTVAPTHKGLAISWDCKSLPQLWPYCWWIAVIIDHFSRKIIDFALFPKQPSAEETIKFLGKAVRKTGKKPKHIITDKGNQFHPPKNAEFPELHPYRIWCRKRNIAFRYGAVGKYGSIAIIERFIKSLKHEGLRRISVSLELNEIIYEIKLYVTWYNQYRPHSYLNARTPQEVYANSPPFKMLQFDSNPKLPELKLQVSYLEGRKHLPIAEIKQVHKEAA